MKQPKIYTILPKLLHGVPKSVEIPNITPETACTFSHFFDTRMDFYLRKVLKANDIKYVWHKRDRLLTINYPGAPFKLFMIFDPYSNYITIRKIPVDNWEYQINAITLDELFNKMLRYDILKLHNLKKLLVPMYLKAQQLKLVYI